MAETLVLRMPVMRTIGTILLYTASSALVVGGGAMAVSVLSPVEGVTKPEVQRILSSSPRIAAWQERMAEEKIYAERYAIREAEEKARWAALGKLPITPDVSASEQSSRNDLDFQERHARARRAQHETMQRTQQEDARQNEMFADAPMLARPRFHNPTARSESGGGN